MVEDLNAICACNYSRVVANYELFLNRPTCTWCTHVRWSIMDHRLSFLPNRFPEEKNNCSKNACLCWNHYSCVVSDYQNGRGHHKVHLAKKNLSTWWNSRILIQYNLYANTRIPVLYIVYSGCDCMTKKTEIFFEGGGNLRGAALSPEGRHPFPEYLISPYTAAYTIHTQMYFRVSYETKVEKLFYFVEGIISYWNHLHNPLPIKWLLTIFSQIEPTLE